MIIDLGLAMRQQEDEVAPAPLAQAMARIMDEATGQDEAGVPVQNRNELYFRKIGGLEVRPVQWLVRGLIERDSQIVFFGDPETGKSLFLGEMLACIATGRDFHGRKVQQGAVAVFVGEGVNGLARRRRAIEIARQIDLTSAPYYVSSLPGRLCDLSTAQNMIDALTAIANESGPLAAIAVDTLARNFGDGDENSTKDMTAFIQSLDLIRAPWKSAIISVHHTGHGDKSRARGSFALKGGADSDFRFDRDLDGTIRIEPLKMKDAPRPAPMAFKIRQVELDMTDEDGEQATSVVMDEAAYEPAVTPGAQGRGKNQALALSTLKGLVEKYRQNLESDGRDPDQARVLTEDWRAACYEKGMTRFGFNKVKRSLEENGQIRFDHGFVACQ